MISRKEIEDLAQLSRLKLSEKELATLEKEFSAILQYVSQIASIQGEPLAISKGNPWRLHNIMREDEVGRTVGGTSEDILAAAPRREGDYIVVRKILSRDEPAL